MRIPRFFLAHTVLSLLLLSCTGIAATHPLILPRGLALDSSGNLYVANTGGNNVLVFSPSYSELSGKTITVGINAPTSLAFDSLGNLWVANSHPSNGGANGSISEYTAGVQNGSYTITKGINNPFSIAIDGIDNLYVNNDQTTLTVYRPTSPFNPPSSALLTDSPANGTTFFGVFASSGLVFVGATDLNGAPLTMYDTEIYFFETGAFEYEFGGFQPLALASDASGNVYFANVDGSIDQLPGRGSIPAMILQVSFVPTGIVVDSKRGRIYLSNYNANQISVYDMGGTLLKVIQ